MLQKKLIKILMEKPHTYVQTDTGVKFIIILFILSLMCNNKIHI